MHSRKKFHFNFSGLSCDCISCGFASANLCALIMSTGYVIILLLEPNFTHNTLLVDCINFMLLFMLCLCDFTPITTSFIFRSIIPPHFRVWTLITGGFTEYRIWNVSA